MKVEFNIDGKAVEFNGVCDEDLVSCVGIDGKFVFFDREQTEAIVEILQGHLTHGFEEERKANLWAALRGE